MKLIVTFCPFCDSEDVSVIETHENAREDGVVRTEQTIRCNACGSEGESTEVWKSAEYLEVEAEVEELESSIEAELNEIIAMLNTL